MAVFVDKIILPLHLLTICSLVLLGRPAKNSPAQRVGQVALHRNQQHRAKKNRTSGDTMALGRGDLYRAAVCHLRITARAGSAACPRRAPSFVTPMVLMSERGALCSEMSGVLLSPRSVTIFIRPRPVLCL